LFTEAGNFRFDSKCGLPKSRNRNGRDDIRHNRIGTRALLQRKSWVGGDTLTYKETTNTLMIKTNVVHIGDPFVLVANGVYYMYATSAPDGFLCRSSLDLVNWKEEGYCYANSTWGENCFWAPEVFEVDGRYALLYTARWKKNHSLRTGLAFSDSPKGPFVDAQDGPLFDLGFATIDATFLFDDDGKIYLYFSRDCSEQVIDGVHVSSIYVSEMKRDLSGLKTEPKLISTPDKPWETSSDPEWWWNEGPAVIKRGGVYYLNFSANCYASRHYCVACSVAKSPLGPFVKYDDNPVLKYREGDFSGPGHNSFFRDRDGKLMTAFHVHTNYDAPSGDRRACFAEVKFDGDGKMRIEV